MLSLSAHLPEIRFPVGDFIVTEGAAAGGLWVLVSGALEVRKGGALVNTITRPGALVGEISVLLGTAVGASDRATEPSTLRHAK